MGSTGQAQIHSRTAKREGKSLHPDLSKQSADAASPGNDPERGRLERKKLEEEIEKLQSEVAVLRNNTTNPGQFLPWLQVLGLGSLIGGLLVLMAGKGLSNVQRDKLDQDVKFAREDHELQVQKLRQELGISRSEHSLKLFEALGSGDPRVRIGAASELGQRVRELNDQVSTASGSAERSSAEREREAIIRVLIAVTKHEDREELQKHIADLVVDLLGACKPDLPESPLAAYDFQGAKLSNAWWKGVDARAVDFYKAFLPRAGLADSRLSNAVFKGADLTGATLRGAAADGANFENANLSGAKANNAVFRDSVLIRANLQGADLRGADLTGAIVTGADFTNAHLDGAILPPGLRRPGAGGTLA